MPRVWFHLIVTTYGSWLPGDPRGFRSWHHKEHIDGDYKAPPPPGQHADRHHFARKSMSEDDIVIPPELRSVVGVALRDRLLQLNGRVLVLSVSGRHAHVQTQLEDCDARIPVGAAKQHAWYALRPHGWQKKLWAKRCKVVANSRSRTPAPRVPIHTRAPE